MKAGIVRGPREGRPVCLVAGREWETVLFCSEKLLVRRFLASFSDARDVVKLIVRDEY